MQTSDVTFLPTKQMPAITTEPERKPLVIRPVTRVPPHIDSLNNAINLGNPIVTANVSGEVRISHIHKQLPNGKYECMALVVVDELILCDSANYQSPFTQ